MEKAEIVKLIEQEIEYRDKQIVRKLEDMKSEIVKLIDLKIDDAGKAAGEKIQLMIDGLGKSMPADQKKIFFEFVD